ncbi:MraY family glycosyltransferase [Flexithrix dorotheae]|uniref:MraY family glycosyltransferase n=1 Tax=Flexithrix dorotheae TaxID=70993 RepID=UPI00037E1546|nr:MraY family glycosyltransferase [Flexithrix dorotheae]
MLFSVLQSLIALVLSLVLFPFAIKFFKNSLILDKPNERKIHTVQKPSMGGVVIFFTAIITILICNDLNTIYEYRNILIALFIVNLTGIFDDLYNLTARYKLLGLVPAVILVVVVEDIRISSFYGLFWLNEIPLWASYMLTIFTIITITNAFNLIDGLDGLAGTLATVAFITLGIWLYFSGETFMATILLVFAGGIIGFLRYNWEPSKIFMGDTGALTLGFLLTISLISFIEKNQLPGVENTYLFNNVVTAAICVIIIPFFDTLRVFSIRIFNGRSPFSPDTNHLHHLTMKLGLGHAYSTLVLAFTNICFIILAIYFKHVDDNFFFYFIFLLGLSASLLLHFLSQNSKSATSLKKTENTAVFEPKKKVA